MEDTEKMVAIDNGGGGSQSHWWWALGGATQLGWGITSCVRGYGGDSRFMVLKAFSVASLFVGGAAAASIAALQASGIRKVCLTSPIFEFYSAFRLLSSLINRVI